MARCSHLRQESSAATMRPGAFQQCFLGAAFGLKGVSYESRVGSLLIHANLLPRGWQPRRVNVASQRQAKNPDWSRTLWRT